MKSALNIIFIGAFLTGCSAFYSEGRGTGFALGIACKDDFKALFQRTYKPFLETNCNLCHTVGGVGKGAFADSDITSAFDDFDIRGPEIIGDRAVDPNHKPPYTGAHLQEEADSLLAEWKALSAQISCEPDTNQDIEDADEPIPESASYKTGETLIPAGDNQQTLSWDLTNDILTPAGTSYENAQFQINIEKDTSPTGETSYLLSSPSLTTGPQALRVSYVEIYINGEFVSSASTFRGINRYVPPLDSRSLSETTMVVPFNIVDGDTIAMAFGILDPVDFNPLNFQQLTGDIFSSQCNSCHSGANPAGGLDMTNYDQLGAQFMVTPFSPNGSEIYKRMTNSNNPMPPSGILPESETNKVRDWIIDGAPNN